MAGRKGFTFAEMIIVVIIMGVFAALTIPHLSFSAVYRKQTEAATRRFVTDLRRTRSMAIRDAADNAQGYRLEIEGNPTHTYKIIDLETNETLETHSFDSSITITYSGGSYHHHHHHQYSGGDQNLDFGPLGNLDTSSANTIQISDGDTAYTITLVYSTGSVQFSESGS